MVHVTITCLFIRRHFVHVETHVRERGAGAELAEALTPFELRSLPQ